MGVFEGPIGEKQPIISFIDHNMYVQSVVHQAFIKVNAFTGGVFPGTVFKICHEVKRLGHTLLAAAMPLIKVGNMAVNNFVSPPTLGVCI